MSHPYDLVLLAPRVVTPAGETAAAVGVRGEQITAVEAYDSGVVDGMEPDRVVRLAEDEVLLPGLVDTHVHVNDPGRTEWEGFHSATRAAAAGGVTTIVDMPLNSIPPTCTVEALTTKRAAAEGQCFVDVGFWGGAIPGNLKDLRGLHDAGVFGFKAFLLDSGVEEFPPLSHDGLDAAMRELASFGATMIVHAEDAATVAHADEPRGGAYASFLASRPAEAEDTAVAEVIDLARRTGCRAHILHLSSAEAMERIRSARTGAVEVTAETCPHYLTLAAEEIADGATQYKCCPPIRGAENRDALWSGLADGTIDFVVSDHSPSTVDLKQPDHGDFGTAWGGISSVQLGLPAVWTEARRRGHTLAEVAGWMATGPAALAGLRGKGRIAVGYDADLCVLAPDEELVVDPARLFHKNPVTAYAGRRLTGRVRGIWLRGRHITPEVEQDGHPRGRLLTRT